MENNAKAPLYKNGSVISDTGPIFSEIASTYDRANTILSFGLHCIWRKSGARHTPLSPDAKILDICCGTGDMAFAFANHHCRPCEITGCDISPAMLEIAKHKQTQLNLKTAFNWVAADCRKLPFSADSFDVVSCAFGIRNVPDFRHAISEMLRVLKPGGRACILEFTLPKSVFLRRIYLVYFRQILPSAGGLISGHPAAYKHLSDSVCHWDNSIDLKSELEAAGFKNATTRNLTFGIAAVYSAFKG
jgi:demethylmenaquinone methyltransferase/2-methoxy-6-polyprenyl-1,4-benzoquinol methylase